MDIIKYLEEAKAKIKAEQERQVSEIKSIISQEVVSFNQEVDRITRDGINKLSVKYSEDKNALTATFNEQLVALAKKFEEDKNTINEAASKKKLDKMNTLIATRTYEIISDCSDAIARLNSQIEEIKK